jgi:predicted MFS family arabinose efflux permease
MIMQRDGDVVRRPAGQRFLARLDTSRWLRLDLVRGPFGYFLAAYLFFYIAQYLPTPLFPVYMVDELGVGESVISIGGALFYLGVMVVSLALDRLNNRYKRQSLLTFGVIAYAVFPITISLFGTVGGVLIGHALGGLAWGFAGTGTLNNLMDKVPEDDRPAHMALNHIIMNIGILAGSFLGPVLGDMVGIQTAILAAGILRIFAGILVGRWA